MRNLKRALSLLLSSAMVLGMLVMGSSAASYTDVTSTHNEEAIEVMKAVSVMVGDENGNFNPDKTVTRAEMAAIMANLLNLDYDYYTGAKTSFTDVPEWASKYVAACQANGIIAGYNSTTYGANDTVTAAQAGLMMMKALGYFQYQGDFEQDWQLATIKQASKINLYDGVNSNATDALTRNQVAQLALNTLEATMVDFTGELGTEVKLPDGTTIQMNYRSEYSNRAAKGGYDYTTTAGTDDNTLQLAEELYGNDLKKTATSDNFGRAADQWKYKTVTVGTYSDKADATYTSKVSRADLYNLVGKSVYDDLTKSQNPSTLTVTVDGKSIASPNVTDYIDKNNTASIGNPAATGNSSSVEVYIDNDTNDVDIVIVNTYLMKASDDYNSKNESVAANLVGTIGVSLKAGETPISSDDFAVKNVKEDDYLLVTLAGSTDSNKEIQSVEPATVITGTVNSYSVGNNVTIDGTKYEYSFSAPTDSGHDKNVSFEIGEQTTVIVDNNGYIMYVDEATVAANKYVYIAEIGSQGAFTSQDYVGDAYFMDGTHKTINLKNKFSDDSSVTKNTTGAWYAYTVNSSEVYTLTKLTAGSAENNTGSVTSTTAGTLVKNGNVTIGIDKGTGTAIKANNSTVFVVVDDDDNVAVYTGVSKVPTIKANTGKTVTANYVVSSNSAFAKYVFIDASDAKIDDATTTSSDFVYLLKYDSTNKDADKNDYYTYKAIVNGEEKTINLGENFSNSETCFTLYTDVKYDENGYVDSMNVVDSNDDYSQVTLSGGSASGIGYEDGILTTWKDNFVVDQNCKIYLIAADNNVKVDAGKSYEVSANISANTLYTMLKGYKLTGNYFAQVNDDTNTLTTLYVYISATAAI